MASMDGSRGNSEKVVFSFSNSSTSTETPKLPRNPELKTDQSCATKASKSDMALLDNIKSKELAHGGSDIRASTSRWESAFIRERQDCNEKSSAMAKENPEQTRQGRASPQESSSVNIEKARASPDSVASTRVERGNLRSSRHEKPRFVSELHSHASSAAFVEKSTRRGATSSPIAHEVVRKVSSRSSLDGGAPADEPFKEAFIRCLELVCDENSDNCDNAYPRDDGEETVVELAFPVSVSRRYAPDFLTHLLSHMQLSRRSLAAVLVYLDRAYAHQGTRMTLCNKNVNVMTMCALVAASRVIERRGFSDDILAMITGMRDARALRRSVSFFLEQIAYDARVSIADTRPYESLLERMCHAATPPPITAEHEEEMMLRQAQIDSRNKVLRMYYPPSMLELESTVESVHATRP